MKRYEFISHTADVKFKAYGKSLENVFENSAKAMFYAMCNKPKGRIRKVNIRVSGKECGSMLYNFLEELIFLMDTSDFFVKDLKIKIVGNELVAELEGVKASEQEIGVVVKAVTYNEMFVGKRNDFWVAQVVVDV